MLNKKRENGTGIKFLLTLTSYTDRKRRIECEDKLRALYPYTIDRKKLLIKKTMNKNMYEVYVDGNIKGKHQLLMGVIVLTLFVLLVSVGIVLCVSYNHKLQKETLVQKDLEAINQEKIRLQKENEQILDSLKIEYETLIEERYENIYPRITYIYSCLPTGSTIKSLVIDKKSFSVELLTSDSLKAFSGFESSPFFLNVKMIRASSKEKNESVTIKGEFQNQNEKITTDGLVMADKILCYKNKVEELHERKRENEARSISAYMEHIKEVLIECGCDIDYMQVKGDVGQIDVECFIFSTSHEMLQFISKIQDEDGSYDIKQFNFRNGIDSQRVQTKIIFDFHKSSLDGEIEIEKSKPETEIDISSLEEAFANKNVTEFKYNFEPIRNITSTSPTEAVMNNKEEVAIEKKRAETHYLSYIGLTKINSQTLIFAKGLTNDTIYKFVLTEDERAGDFCVGRPNGFYACQDGLYYEVSK